jgi:sarcosine oxidase
MSGTAIVVGAGAFGAAAADALAGRGWAVTVVEQYAPANARGSSGDRTRMLRLGHGDSAVVEQDLWYIRSAARGIAMWRELDPSLLAETGLVWFARSDDGSEARAAERLELAGEPFSLLDPAAVGELFPDVATDDLTFGLWEPGACVIRAGAAVEALLRRALGRGVELRLGRASPAAGGGVAVDGAVLGADCVVWACGAWLGSLVGAPVRPAWQDVLHWGAPAEWRDGPAWFDNAVGVYGFPDVDGLGVKAVTHVPGPPFDLDRDERMVRAAAVDEIRAFLAHRFPALARVPLLWGRVMPYEMTPDSHFAVGACPGRAGEWIMGGGSGHGFKHAPALGEHVADLIEGRAQPVPWFAPDRVGE